MAKDVRTTLTQVENILELVSEEDLRNMSDDDKKVAQILVGQIERRLEEIKEKNK